MRSGSNWIYGAAAVVLVLVVAFLVIGVREEETGGDALIGPEGGSPGNSPEGAVPGAGPSAGAAPAAGAGPRAGGTGPGDGSAGSGAIPSEAGAGNLPPGAQGPGTAGRVVDARTRKPVAGAAVAWKTGGGGGGPEPATGASGEDGAFRIGSVEASAGLRLEVRKTGYKPFDIPAGELRAGAGPSADLGDLLLEPLPILRGRVLDKDRHPVPSAAVLLSAESGFQLGRDFDPAQIGERMLREDAVLAETRPDEKGEFAFWTGDVPDGTCSLRALAEGLATGFVHWLELKAGTEPEPVELLLGPAASISGLVADASGAPVEGALVMSLAKEERREGFDGRFTMARTWARTDAEGAFLLAGLSPGPYSLVVRKEGLPVAGKENVSAPAEGVRIVVPAGLPAEGLILDDATGKPVAGARITFFSDGEGGFGTALSGADGGYRIDAVSEGAYNVWIAAPGYPRLTEKVRIDPGRNFRREFRLKCGITLSGKVLCDKTREPVAGAEVLTMDGMLFGGRDKGRAVSGPDGFFVLENVSGTLPGMPESEDPAAPKQIFLLARKAGWIQAVPGIVALQPGERARADLEVFLVPGIRVSGTVVDPAGLPVKGVELTASSTGGIVDFFDRMTGKKPERLLTGEDGRFDLTVPPLGQLRVSHPEWAEQTAEFGQDGRGVASRTVQIRLTRGGAVAGVAVDEQGKETAGERLVISFGTTAPESAGRPPEDDPFYTASDGGWTETTTDDNGAFAFSRLRPGTWTLSVRSKKYHLPKGVLVQVSEGATARTRLILLASLVISGTVVGPSGAPAAGARVVVTHEPSMRTTSTLSGEDGSFRVEGLPPGGYVVQAFDEQLNNQGKAVAQAGDQGIRIVLDKREEEEKK